MIKLIKKYQKIKQFRLRPLLSIIILFFFCFSTIPMIVDAADTIIVDDDGAGDYTSIQDAIDNANVGDYIIVKDGTYGDQLSVYVNGLTISAASGETPTIYVSSYSPGIDITGSDVTFGGFEIYGNGSLTGGIYPTFQASTGSDGLIIINNTFKVFTGEIGQCGLYISSGVINVSFISNTLIGYENQICHAAQIIGQQIYYGSIQDAINYAISGNTINVATGLYNERLVIDKELNLIGNGNSTIIQPTTVPTPGVYDVEIDANGTTLQNFLFDFNGPSDTRSGNGIVVSDMLDPPVFDVLITNNEIYTGHTNTGIQTGKYSDVSGLTITNNIFYADYDGLGEGIYINPYSGNDIVNINNNQFYGNLYSAISIESGNVSAINNIINSNTTKGIYGIRYIELTGGETFYNVEIGYNDIQNVTYGIRVGTSTDVGSSLTSEIFYNTIYENDVGIWVRYGANLSNSVNDNSIYNNSIYGLNNEGNTIVSAENNWWGNNSGPYNPISNPTGTGDNVSVNVTFKPWNEFDGYTIPPTVEYVVGNPKSYDEVTISESTEIKIYAEDNETGIDTVTYRLWNTTSRWGSWIDYTEGFTLSGDGKHWVNYNATDNAGNENNDLRLQYVDTIPPEVNVIYPNGGEYINNGVQILWEANDKIPDQIQTNWNHSLTISEDYPGHIQSFNPAEGKLNSVQLLIEGDDANITVKIFSNITGVPIQIGQAVQHLQYIGNPNFPVWIDFPLESEIDLDIEETYYIGVTQEIFGSTGFKWYYFNSSGGSNAYDYGQAWIKTIDALILKPDWDWGFKTMKWEDDLDIEIQYSMTGIAPWSTMEEDVYNDGSYFWDTENLPDGESYKIRIIAEDYIVNLGGDTSDDRFTIDNVGPSIRDIIITDTTIDNTNYTKDGNNIEITATITGDPITIEADLSNFGGGTNVTPFSYTGTTAEWILNSITCTPSNGQVTVEISAKDSTGDSSFSTGSIIADNEAPLVEITRPGPGLYFMDSMRLLPFSYPFIIGQITMSVDAEDNGSGIEKVEFYLENRLESTVYEIPYNWLWDEAATGFFKLEVIAYDNVGHSKIEEMRDIFIINLDIFG